MQATLNRKSKLASDTETLRALVRDWCESHGATALPDDGYAVPATIGCIYIRYWPADTRYGYDFLHTYLHDWYAIASRMTGSKLPARFCPLPSVGPYGGTHKYNCHTGRRCDTSLQTIIDAFAAHLSQLETFTLRMA